MEEVMADKKNDDLFGGFKPLKDGSKEETILYGDLE